MAKRIIISLGGSIIIPKTGFDPVFLKSFVKLLRSEVQQGKQFVLIVGGGGTARAYQDALRNTVNPTNDQLDWVGIAATRINAAFVQQLFSDISYKEVVADPTKKVNTNKPLIIASGWKPGNSTDHGAVLFAKTYGATDVLNLSNIAYVYDKDPAVYPDAKIIEAIDWKAFRTLVGDTWDPGANLPFDPIASKMAEKLHLRVGILKGTELAEVKKAIAGKRFNGTVIA